jgi:hypothetical protein
MSEQIATWIKQNLTPAKAINLVWPGGSLKHEAECDFGLRVTVRHADFEAAMTDCGFEPITIPGRADGPFYKVRWVRPRCKR